MYLYINAITGHVNKGSKASIECKCHMNVSLLNILCFTNPKVEFDWKPILIVLLIKIKLTGPVFSNDTVTVIIFKKYY
jgi:hypothetical protein